MTTAHTGHSFNPLPARVSPPTSPTTTTPPPSNPLSPRLMTSHANFRHCSSSRLAPRRNRFDLPRFRTAIVSNGGGGEERDGRRVGKDRDNANKR